MLKALAKFSGYWAKEGVETAEDIYMAIWKYTLYLGAYLVVMLAFNLANRVWGAQLMFLILIPFMAFVLLAPRTAVIALALGTGNASLKDTDLSQGSRQGLVDIYRLIVGILFYACLVAGFLATWPLWKTPWAIVPAAGVAMALVLMSIHYRLDTRARVIFITTIYSIVVLLYAFAGNTGPMRLLAAYGSSLSNAAFEHAVKVETGRDIRILYDDQWLKLPANGEPVWVDLRGRGGVWVVMPKGRQGYASAPVEVLENHGYKVRIRACTDQTRMVLQAVPLGTSLDSPGKCS